MNELREVSRRMVATLLLILMGAAPTVAAERTYGAATPQELVARMEAAAQAEDFGEMMACLSPDDRKAMGGMMVMMAVMMVGFSQMATDMGGAMAEGMAEAFAGEEMTADQKVELETAQAEAAVAAAALEAKLRAALEPHGLAGMLDEPEAGSAEERALDEALESADMIALTESMLQLMAELDEQDGEEDEDAGSAADEMKPDWSGVEVTDYVVEGDRATARAGDETLEMVRIDGRWYFSPQMATEEEPPPGP